MKKVLILLMFVLCSCSIKPTNMEIVFNDSYLHRYLDSYLNDGYQLIDALNGDNIKWEILSGNCYIENNILRKTETASEYERIKLKATVNNKEYIFDNLTLLDKYIGTLITYFTGEEKDDEQLYYAFTYDGYLWYSLNDGKSVLKANIGSKRLRDPSFVRKKDGGFYLIATQGYNNPSIYVFDTDNLYDFKNERLLKVNVSSNDLKTKEKEAWAPEGFYDYRIDKYVVYYSAPSDSKILYNYSSDFNDISYPNVMIDLGFPVIDATIVKENANYYIILKDERKPMEKYSRLFTGKSKLDYRNFDDFNFNYISEYQSEGPFVVSIDTGYLLYYDNYTRSKFETRYFESMAYNEFLKESDEKTMIHSLPKLKHGSSIRLTWKEIERLKEKYNF